MDIESKDIGLRQELRILDCGHHPSPHGEHTTGSARDTSNGRDVEVCCECAFSLEKDAMANGDRYTAYLSLVPGASAVTTWTGHTLGNVTHCRKGKHNMAGTMYYFDFTAWDGSKWYGRGVGSGMICNVHRRKVKRAV